MTEPLNLSDVRRDQRRVAALLGASGQLDVIVPTYRGIPYEHLYKSKFYKQLKKGEQITQMITCTPRNSPSQFYFANEIEKNVKKRETQGERLRFSASAQSMSSGVSEKDQLQLRKPRHGRGGRGGVNDNNVLVKSRQSSDEKRRFGYERFQTTEGKTNQNEQAEETSRNQGYNNSESQLASASRGKRKKSSRLNTSLSGSNYRRSSKLNQLETVPGLRLTPDHNSDEKFPQPQTSSTCKTSQVLDYDSSVRADRPLHRSRKRSCESAKVQPVLHYHHDVIGLGVDLSVQSGALPDSSAETNGTTLISSNDNEVGEFTTSPENSAFVSKQSPVCLSTKSSTPCQLQVLPHSSAEYDTCDLGEHVYRPSESSGGSSQYTGTVTSALERKLTEESVRGLKASSYQNNHDHDYRQITGDNKGLPGFGYDSWSEAYVKALSAARCRNLPGDFEDFVNRTTRPYTFSYFSKDHCTSCKCHNCLKEAWKKRHSSSKFKMPKPATGMKGILGNVKVYDYFNFAPRERSLEKTE